MARISAIDTAAGLRVTIAGELQVRELRRLERVCGRAIERRRPFELVVEDEASLAPPVRIYIDRLRTLGRASRS